MQNAKFENVQIVFLRETKTDLSDFAQTLHCTSVSRVPTRFRRRPAPARAGPAVPAVPPIFTAETLRAHVQERSARDRLAVSGATVKITHENGEKQEDL